MSEHEPMAIPLAAVLDRTKAIKRAALHLVKTESEGRPVPENYAITHDGMVLKSKKTRLRKSRSLGEVIAKPTAVRWAIKNELERGVTAVLSGPRGTYKSFKALDWAMQLAVRGEPVFVLSAEGGGFDRRARAWLLVNAPEANASAIPLRVIERRMDLSTEAGLAELESELEALRSEYGKPVALCVIDTLSKSHGLDEKDNSQMASFLGKLDTRLRTPHGCTVLIVGHTGHGDKSRIRGASSIESDTEAAYVVSRKNDSISITRERFKDAGELPPLTYRPRIVDLGYRDEDGKPVTSLVLDAVSLAVLREQKTGSEPRGSNQKAVMKVAREVALIGISFDGLIAAVMRDVPGEPRKDPYERAARHLCALGHLKYDANTEVISLPGAQEVDGKGFDE